MHGFRAVTCYQHNRSLAEYLSDVGLGKSNYNPYASVIGLLQSLPMTVGESLSISVELVLNAGFVFQSTVTPAILLTEDHSPVDMEHLSGHKRAIVTCQEIYAFSDIGWLPSSAQRHTFTQVRPFRFRMNRHDPRRCRETRSNRVDTYTVWCHFEGQ